MCSWRTAKTIHSVGLVWLDERGVLHEAGEPPPANATHGARIGFTNASGAEKTLYYFSTDLSNSVVRSSGFLKFCETLGPGDSLLKSASYLLHSVGFSTVRSWLLTHSATIIQDDSGIPLASYDSKAWRFLPFGRYAGPIDKFPDKYQDRYADLFADANPLDFGIGYRWRPRESNVLLAVRLPAGDAGPPTETAAAQANSGQPRRPDSVVRSPAPIALSPPPLRDGLAFWPHW
jgi:hypothetical protein